MTLLSAGPDHGHAGPYPRDPPASHRLADWAARYWPWSHRPDTVAMPAGSHWLGWDGWVYTARPDRPAEADAEDRRPV